MQNNMAVDKKSEHVGNHGGRYVDNTGLTKQFVTIDHDKKVRIASMNSTKLEKNWQDKYRTSLMERLLAMSASLAPVAFSQVTIRGEAVTTIQWNKEELNKLETDKLRTLCVLCENKLKK